MTSNFYFDNVICSLNHKFRLVGPILVELLSIMFAILMSLFIFEVTDPFSYPFMDDAGIVMRYLDNFRNGLFYVYNAQDGPVFGISGFLHGVLSGFFVYFFGVSSEMALVLANFMGSILFFWGLVKLF